MRSNAQSISYRRLVSGSYTNDAIVSFLIQDCFPIQSLALGPRGNPELDPNPQADTTNFF